MDEEPDGPYFTLGRAVSAVVLVLLLFGASWLARDWEDPREVLLVAPLVIIVVLVGGVLLWFAGSWMIERRRQRSRAAAQAEGRCGQCGYDLRESDDTCPECGEPIWRPRDPLTGRVIRRVPDRRD